MVDYIVAFDSETRKKIEDAICVIKNGMCKRVDVSKTVKVYDCGGVIRIDLKKEELER